MSRSFVVGTLALVVLAVLSPLAHAQPARATQLIVLIVEVLDRDPTPVIACGILGAQPRDVTARVVSVETGTFTDERILLRWPMCADSQVMVGERYRIHLRRWTDAAPTLATRYRVRRAEHVASP